ncbi:MAG: DUF1064 domain-containing protein [Lutibacter sp.]|jgi:hypothetical protein
MSKSSSLRWKQLPDNLKNRIMGEPSNLVEKPFEPEKTVKSKYHNIKCEYQGIKFDSKKEMNFYLDLLNQQKFGWITKIEIQPEFPYVITYCLPLPGDKSLSMVQKAKYIADFRVTYPDGHVEIIDVKEFKTTVYKRKKKIIRKLYGIEIKEV